VPKLKLICLLAWFLLIGFQLALPWLASPPANYWSLLLAFPLLIPLRGMLYDRRYTYKWVGFLTLPYFCIGISELVSNPQLRVYGFGATVASMLLFLGSIYYARFLALQRRD
jgi:uncharacterized membrane protein